MYLQCLHRWMISYQVRGKYFSFFSRGEVTVNGWCSGEAGGTSRRIQCPRLQHSLPTKLRLQRVWKLPWWWKWILSVDLRFSVSQYFSSKIFHLRPWWSGSEVSEWFCSADWAEVRDNDNDPPWLSQLTVILLRFQRPQIGGANIGGAPFKRETDQEEQKQHRWVERSTQQHTMVWR